MRNICFFAIAAAVSNAALGQAVQSPCASAKDCVGSDADRLNSAWSSGSTTSDQRSKMTAIIAAHESNGSHDWKGAADEYFRWRGGQEGYDYDKLQANSAKSEADALAKERQKYRQMRQLGEAAIRGRLIDPSSAQFEWPHGFIEATWKPLLQRRVSGWVTCGFVNAKNRMGGYTGASPFVVVINGGVVTFADMDGQGGMGVVAAGCSKAAFPPPQPNMLDDQQAPSPTGSLADELAKLAALKTSGAITQAEFEAAKAKLLSK